MKKDFCKLCNNKRDLCKSHIIPEFLYTPIYEINHSYHRYSSDTPFPKKARQGLYDRLFCLPCEKILKEFEDYVKNIWFNSDINSKQKEFVSIIKDINYTLLKLFQLSIIWRASISNLEEFSSISLGQKHENIIRQRIWSRSPGPFYDYGCILIHANDAVLQDFVNNSIMIHPSIKIDGHLVYPISFAAFIWFFYVSSHLRMYELSNLFLQECNELPIVHDPVIVNKFLKNIVRTINK